jgi:hypothetical protein
MKPVHCLHLVNHRKHEKWVVSTQTVCLKATLRMRRFVVSAMLCLELLPSVAGVTLVIVEVKSVPSLRRLRHDPIISDHVQSRGVPSNR